MHTFDSFPSPDDALWQAVLDRDAARDGTFVYAVRSTGVFCRPSCASRRAQVRFFAVNPVSLVVPCHRAVGADGQMRGSR